MSERDDAPRLQRSPSYPFLSLEESVDSIRTLYEREKQSAVPRGVAGKALGFSNVNGGVGGRTLSALGQYGLLEDVGAGKVKVSDLALRILFARDDIERRSLLAEAAVKPKLFADILSLYPAGLPSDDALRHLLVVERHFNPDAVSAFLKAFRQTLVSAGLIRGVDPEAGELDGPTPGSIVPATVGAPQVNAGPTTGVLSFTWPISLSRGLIAELRLRGGPWGRSDVLQLKKYLDLLDVAVADPATLDPD